MDTEFGKLILSEVICTQKHRWRYGATTPFLPYCVVCHTCVRCGAPMDTRFDLRCDCSTQQRAVRHLVRAFLEMIRTAKVTGKL